MSDVKYVMVTTTQVIRNRYVTPLDKLLDEDGLQADPSLAVQKAISGDIPCFSQFGAGELVIDAQVLSEDSVIDLFDADHSSHKDLEKDEKIKLIISTPTPNEDQQN